MVDKPLLFISHITEERELAQAFKDMVEHAFLGMIDVFVSSDAESITMGSRWLDEISDALKRCAVEIVVCSPHSVSRSWITFEAGAGWNRGIPVIPICHSGMTPSKLPVPLNMLQGATATDAVGIGKVLPVLAKALGSKTPGVDVAGFVAKATTFEEQYHARDKATPAPAPSTAKLNGDPIDRIIPQMTEEAKSQLVRLQEELHAPGQRLANVVRRAVVVASMLGKHEYRILFEKHLAGFIRGVPNPPAQFPGGYKPEIDPTEAWIYDRSRRDGNVQTPTLDELEEIYNRATSAVSSDSAAAGEYLGLLHDLTSAVVRIRNRVNSFIASVLAPSTPLAASRETTSLTRLLSLTEFTKDLVTLLGRNQKHTCVAFADMDNLKELNSKIGHDSADKVIKGVAELLTGALLNRGTLYHRSGDEFLVILENHAAAEAATLMGRVCQRVAEHDFEQGLAPGSVTISVGVVEHGVHASGADALRAAAERANKAAKEAGKNCVFVPTTGKGPTG